MMKLIKVGRIEYLNFCSNIQNENTNAVRTRYYNESGEQYENLFVGSCLMAEFKNGNGWILKDDQI